MSKQIMETTTSMFNDFGAQITSKIRPNMLPSGKNSMATQYANRMWQRQNRAQREFNTVACERCHKTVGTEGQKAASLVVTETTKHRTLAATRQARMPTAANHKCQNTAGTVRPKRTTAATIYCGYSSHSLAINKEKWQH